MCNVLTRRKITRVRMYRVQETGRKGLENVYGDAAACFVDAYRVEDGAGETVCYGDDACDASD